MSMMDTGSEDTASLASYYDNADSTRTSGSFQDQSDESDSDQEPDDHEADIDKMLMDLEGFEVVGILSYLHISLASNT
jgi:hypothetical protein